jgi:hypothetical protein
LLPPRLRHGFGLEFAATECAAAARALSWLRLVYPHLPPAVRHVGPYREACARLCGRSRPSLGTRIGNRFWIGHSRMPY